MNKSIQNYLDVNQVGGLDWPTDAVFAAKHRMSAWPTGWCDNAVVSFFVSLGALETFLARKAIWAKGQDNLVAIQVYEWNLGPVERADLSVNVAEVGTTLTEKEQEKVVKATIVARAHRQLNGVQANETFNRLVAGAPSLPFDSRWVGKCGDLDNAVQGEASPMLAVGVVAVSSDYRGRAILFIGVGYGVNVVLRQRSAVNALTGLVTAESLPSFDNEFNARSHLLMDEAITELHMQWICKLALARMSYSNASMAAYKATANLLVPDAVA